VCRSAYFTLLALLGRLGWRPSSSVDDVLHQSVVENLAAVSTRLTGTAQTCGTVASATTNKQNDPTNCGKLNAPAVFNPGLMQVTQNRGTYYLSTHATTTSPTARRSGA
jgi:hypothetical protein